MHYIMGGPKSWTRGPDPMDPTYHAKRALVEMDFCGNLTAAPSGPRLNPYSWQCLQECIERIEVFVDVARVVVRLHLDHHFRI